MFYYLLQLESEQEQIVWFLVSVSTHPNWNSFFKTFMDIFLVFIHLEKQRH